MARRSPNSATSSFLCIGDQAELGCAGKRNPEGQGFVAFGQVANGMDIVKNIQLSSQGESQRLLPPIPFVMVVRKE